MSDCSICPQVVDENGNKADSRLFQDLLSVFKQDRVKAKEVYLKAVNPTSKNRFREAGIKFDKYDEPVFTELYMKTDLKSSYKVPLGDLQRTVNLELGHYKKGENRPALSILNEDNYKKLSSKAAKFNRESPYRSLFVARVERIPDSESSREYYNIHAVPRTQFYSKEAKQLEYNESLNKKLTDILESHGVGIGALNELERRMKVNGVTDFDTAKRTAEGLVEIIRLADGTIGKAALPEEFAHFILRALGKQPLADRLVKLIRDNNLSGEILEDSYQEYFGLYEGSEAKLAEEAAGKLLAKHLLQAEKIPSKPYKGLLERLIKYIKEFFKGFSSEGIQRAMNDADKDAGRLAKEILSGHLDNDISLSNIGESGVFYSTEKKLNKIDELLKKIIDNENRRYIVYSSRGKRNFNAKQQDYIMELVSKLHANESKLGIVRFLGETTEVIKKVNEKLKELRDTPPTSMNDAALILRDVRNYIYSYENILKDMKSTMREASEGEFSDDIKKSIDDVIYFLSNIKMDYAELARPLFTQFIKAYFGDSKIIPFGKYKGETITAEKLASLDVKDIGFFDRWLDSMASSSSYIANVMDASVKEARNQARLNTIKMQKKLEQAALELESSGVKGFEWMFEKKNNKKTGNYITKEEADKLSPAQKKFYNTVMEMKEGLDNLLPDEMTTLRSAVKIRKDLIERVKGAKDIKSGAKEIWEGIKDGWIRRGDDTEFGEESKDVDFEGNKIMKLPIFYLRMRAGESAEDLSTDIVSTMTAYAAMVNDYSAMNKVIDILELSRDMVRDAASEGGMNKAQNLIKRINDFFEMQVYGRYIKDEGTIGDSKIEVAKAANKLNAYTAICKMGLNLLSGISNVATGDVQMKIEGAARQFFKLRDVAKADRIYGKHLGAYLGEIGSRVKTSKLALWGELFNVQQDYDTKTKEVNFDRKTWFSKMFNSNTLFFLNNSGEHWMAYRTSLALASAYKMKAPDGRTVSLWDAMEVRYLDPNNKRRGAELVVKEGYLKEDGTEFTDEDILKFTNKCAVLNQRMHGVYNRDDKDAFQKISIGRMVMMFRKYIKENLNKRYQSIHYDERLGDWTEGYYRTMGRFINQCIKDIREGQFALVANFRNLDVREKQNIRRAAMELGHVIILGAVLGILDHLKDDDDEKPWLLSMLEYQARRLYTEIGSLTPGLQMPGEALRLVKQPAAAVSSMETLLDLFGLMNPYNYEVVGGEDALIKSGKYKGHNKAYKLFFDAVPWQPLYKGLHPAESIPFYKQ